MSHFPDELRLLILIAVNVFVFIAAFRFSRRMTGQDWIGSSLDALLIHYLVQYVSVCVPGLLGILRAETMMMLAVVCGTGMLLFRSVGVSPARFAERAGDTPTPRVDTLIVVACLLFVLGYFAALANTLSNGALYGDDALTYHLPAAALWIQTGHIALYNTWFFNPANTYSPLAGSTFLVWLIAPIGADQLAQFVQMPALILMFFAIIQIDRSLGVRSSIAAIAAVAALLSRPFISESILIKDDHFLAAFFLAVVAGCASERLRDRLAPWRIGVAIGLFFATKYTALLTAPIFVLLIDAPFRADWKIRHWLIAIASCVLLAGPWYVRNWVLTGNPLYPVPISIAGLHIFKGMFIPERSTEMRTPGGAWHALTGGFNSPSQTLMIVLLVLWACVLLCKRRQLRDNPLVRTLLLGPLIGLPIFFLASHAALIRYAYPSLLLLFATAALVCSKRFWLPVGILLVLAGISIWGGFEFKQMLEEFVLTGVIVATVGTLALMLLRPRMGNPRVALSIYGAAALCMFSCIFVLWHAVLMHGRASMMNSFSTPYPQQYPTWKFIDENLPPDATIAYTNLVFTRPLMGFDYSRRVFYIPTRAGVRTYADLPDSRTRVTDQDIRAFVAKLLTANPDHDLWLANLLHSDAQYLLIGTQPILVDPPERAFANLDPTHFQRIWGDNWGTLYQIRR